ncbi:MAG: HDIG domain-containing protein [Candidatus Glassbacteria bacterium]|nr:HDIG domain-containing protein [Candidatus Glassbacteria bacterium]
MAGLQYKFRLKRKRFVKWFRTRTMIGHWPANPYFKHGSRIALAMLLAWLALMLTPGRRFYDPFFDIQAGSVADQDVIAPFDFPVYKNSAELELERQLAADQVKPVLEFLPGVRETVVDELLNFFSRLENAWRDTSLAPELIRWDRFNELRTAGSSGYAIKPIVLNYLYSLDSSLSVSDEEIVYLFDPVRSNVLKTRLKDFLVGRLREGVIGDGAYDRIENKQVSLRRSGREEEISFGELTSIAQVYEQAAAVIVDPEYPELSKSLFLQILSRFLQTNVVFNLTETDRLRQVAAGTVSPTREEMVLEGERIIGQGERVDPAQIERLDNLRGELERRGLMQGDFAQRMRELGIWMIYLMLLIAAGIYLKLHCPHVYDRFSNLMLIALCFLIVLGLSWLVLVNEELPAYLLPVAIGSMLISYLIDDEVAMVGSLCLTLMLGVQSNFSISVVLLSLAAGVVASVSVRNVESRGAQYVPIIYIALAYLVVLLALDYGYRGSGFLSVMTAAGWCAVNATISTFITIALLPLFEHGFKITSNFTLLELGDLNRPLLKRLALEAPGTYHHSIIIGSLAEAAAAGIGANPVYARVASYYHDIGKVKQPNYFIENQAGRANPHNKLSPKMSSLIISNHVKEGVELARKAKLPECIIDVIRQHHGDQSISFFFYKEKEKNPDTTLVESDFRYPGPRPMSRETAIIMLADAADSASRTLSDPTVSRIRSLIKGLIEAKLRDGQLDNTELTLRDLTRIGEEFLTILIGVHHSRIDYPPKPDKEKNDQQRRQPDKGEVDKDLAQEDRGVVYSSETDDERDSD